MNPWIKATVLEINRWTENLFSLILRASISSFKAGQFTKLALQDFNKKKIQRAYSYVNAPNDTNIEIYIRRISNGNLSNQLYYLKNGSEIFIKKNAYGFFVLDEIPDSEILWMFATGAAIGPYCSILQERKNTHRFKKIVLVHAAKYQNELNYLPLMKKLLKIYDGQLKIQTILSQEESKYSLVGRIPFLLSNKSLEKKIGLNINKKNSHIMLCGNPNMIKDTYNFLKTHKNMKKNLRRAPGHITVESYW
ncbi:ferredoxin--NADP(+) reductase [Buchnera aphidicola (Muscaphis stroyani)]|uniref:Flavodoxin/ferredoxin--NADP reductase n=1 Tax=Buchnera aphidicola (Muscaphis stroyani) TaxID=1241869 RepID=A0A4D6YFX8_9GAMM|nr:FAD-binding oxidoreductase [Buchnera aphidicola]QCI24610.1 ferredoxin--NADP(+) reductase [Buchnera aphidicola (Muscaphis stroyani)]